MRVVVTGGAGFIGANVVRDLIGRGHILTVVDDLSTGDARHLAGTAAHLVEGDVRDAAMLERTLPGTGAVVHLAAAGSVMGSVEDPVGNFEANVIGTFRTLAAALRAGAHRVVVASSGGALFGDAELPVDESSLPAPVSPYGASKLAAEGYSAAFARTYGLPTVVLRFANVYGTWSERKGSAVNTFLRAIATGRPITIYGDGSASRDFVHVDDVSTAVRLALERDLAPGTIIHIASGRETTMSELADICRAVAGARDHPVRYVPRRHAEVQRNCASYGRASSLLGWSPTIGLEDGIARTWSWLRDRWDLAAPSAHGQPGTVPG